MLATFAALVMAPTTPPYTSLWAPDLFVLFVDRDGMASLGQEGAGCES
jgi:hypothetical protein